MICPMCKGRKRIVPPEVQPFVAEPSDAYGEVSISCPECGGVGEVPTLSLKDVSNLIDLCQARLSSMKFATWDQVMIIAKDAFELGRQSAMRDIAMAYNLVPMSPEERAMVARLMRAEIAFGPGPRRVEMMERLLNVIALANAPRVARREG